jgi:hypothetical protein
MAGTMQYVNGDQYVGGWHQDLRSGQGTYKYANGARSVINNTS